MTIEDFLIAWFSDIENCAAVLRSPRVAVRKLLQDQWMADLVTCKYCRMHIKHLHSKEGKPIDGFS